MIEKKHYESIDIAKGIGILLVVFGHLTVGKQNVYSFIYSFHMPLFFLLSGLFSSNKDSLKNILISCSED